MPLVAIAFLLVLTAQIAQPQDMPLPAEVQLPLLLKILSADRRLQDRAGDELVIGVLYQPRYRASVTAMEAILEQAAKLIVPPRPGQTTRLVPVPLNGKPDWDSLLSALDLDVCYLTPFRALGLEQLLRATRARGVVTCTGVLEYIEAGVSIGLDVSGGRPQIVINMAGARAEGIEFSSQLLKLARIVDKE
ncbi:MAG TPA: YfiR family protein [bacterium]|nr:YfiR family protein [bacterium]